MPDTVGHDDRLHEECGVVGVWNCADAAAVAALGLHALQHRGQEATGIVSFDGTRFHSHRGLGLVGDNFSDARVIAALPGSRAVGHNRYATTGDTVLRNVQPLYADFEFGGLAVAHNGNLTNATALRRALVRRGCLFQSTTDSEVFIHLIAISLYATVLDRLIDASIALPDGQIEGGVIRFSVADGHAFYYVTSESPLILQHIPFLDAYEIDAATIRGLNREDVVELIRQERSLRSLLAPRKPPAQPPAPRVIAPGPLAW